MVKITNYEVSDFVIFSNFLLFLVGSYFSARCSQKLTIYIFPQGEKEDSHPSKTISTLLMLATVGLQSQ
jgi:hypothetical protein